MTKNVQAGSIEFQIFFRLRHIEWNKSSTDLDETNMPMINVK